MTEKNQKDPVENSYSLKKYRLKQWIAAKGYTQTFVAKKLGLEIMELKRKLNEREPFTREQIFALIDMVGLEAAYHIIFFPEKKKPKEGSGE